MNSNVSIPDRDRDFHGCVLATGEINGYDDSDFYAIVWDEQTQSVRRIDDGTTRFAAPAKYSRADASPEVFAKAHNWLVTSYLPPIALKFLRSERTSPKHIGFGDEVIVARGRKIPIGTVGEVFGVYDNPYHRAWRSSGWAMHIPRFDPKSRNVGIRLLDGSRQFTSLANVERVSVPLPTQAEVDAKVRELASSGFNSIFSPYWALSVAFA